MDMLGHDHTVHEIATELERDLSQWWQNHRERAAKMDDLILRPDSEKLATGIMPGAERHVQLNNQQNGSHETKENMENMEIVEGGAGTDDVTRAALHDSYAVQTGCNILGRNVWGGYGTFGAVGTIGGSNHALGHLGIGNGRLQRGLGNGDR